MGTVRSMVRGVVERVLCAAPRNTRSGDALILAYHNTVRGVRNRALGDVSLHMPLEDFEDQLNILRSETDVIPLAELLAFSPGPAKAASRLSAVTFDDAYHSAISDGLSVCERQGISATVFVAPGILGTYPQWDIRAMEGRWTATDRDHFIRKECHGPVPSGVVSNGVATLPESLRIATEHQLESAVKGTRHFVGNHTFDHVNLGILTTADAREQIQLADAWLQDRFPQQYLPVLSYPFGIPPVERAIVVEGSPVVHGLQISGGWCRAPYAVSPMAVPRWNVPAGISAHGFRARLRGWLT